MSSASFYPPALMLLPIQVLERLPPSIQAIDLEALMVVHCVSDSTARHSTPLVLVIAFH